MSEVTELTNEQVEQIAKKYWRDANVRTITEEILIKIAQEAYAAGRLSTQGAGPTEQEISEWFHSKPIWDMRWKLSNPESGLTRTQQKVKLLQVFSEQFFRAPIDPPRPETPDHVIDFAVATIAKEQGWTLPDTDLIEFGVTIWKEAVRMRRSLSAECGHAAAVDEHGREVKR